MFPVLITAGYDRNDSAVWASTGIHGHVTVKIGRHAVARIECRDDSRAAEDYPLDYVEETVAEWLAERLAS